MPNNDLPDRSIRSDAHNREWAFGFGQQAALRQSQSRKPSFEPGDGASTLKPSTRSPASDRGSNGRPRSRRTRRSRRRPGEWRAPRRDRLGETLRLL